MSVPGWLRDLGAFLGGLALACALPAASDPTPVGSTTAPIGPEARDHGLGRCEVQVAAAVGACVADRLTDPCPSAPSWAEAPEGLDPAGFLTWLHDLETACPTLRDTPHAFDCAEYPCVAAFLPGPDGRFACGQSLEGPGGVQLRVGVRSRPDGKVRLVSFLPVTDGEARARGDVRLRALVDGLVSETPR